MKKLLGLLVVLVAAMLVLPSDVMALSGTGVGDTKIKVDSKAGGEWFRAVVKKTDDRGVLKMKNSVPGWYKFSLRGEDQDATGAQNLAVELRMLDNEGRNLKDEETFTLYQNVGGVKVNIGTATSDDEGWVKIAGLSFDTEYKLDLPQDKQSHVSKKENTARIKIKTKINGDYFDSGYFRTERDLPYVLEYKNVLPGKYKFKYKTGDRDPTLPFTLKAKMLNDHGKEIDEPTIVELYGYFFTATGKVRQPLGALMTDDEGWVTIPGVMTGMTYKIKVKD